MFPLPQARSPSRVRVGDMSPTERPPQRRGSAQMKRTERIAIGATGLGSWVAGSIATFTRSEGSGAAALIAAGVAASILALIGHWPSRMVVSGNELSWDDVVESVDQQIEAATDAGENTAVRELEDLRRRLSEAQRTGSLPVHPAAEYDEALFAALRRVLPGLAVSAAPGRARDQADFELKMDQLTLLVESKYKSDPRRPFRGSTLSPLLSRVRGSDRLLVVTNAIHVDDARTALNEAIGTRGRVISWLGPKDDDALRAAVDELLR